jgi:hypothetical protein
MLMIVVEQTFQLYSIISIVNLNLRLFDNKSQILKLINHIKRWFFFICIAAKFNLVVMEGNHNIHV